MAAQNAARFVGAVRRAKPVGEATGSYGSPKSSNPGSSIRSLLDRDELLEDSEVDPKR